MRPREAQDGSGGGGGRQCAKAGPRTMEGQGFQNALEVVKTMRAPLAGAREPHHRDTLGESSAASLWVGKRGKTRSSEGLGTELVLSNVGPRMHGPGLAHTFFFLSFSKSSPEGMFIDLRERETLIHCLQNVPGPGRGGGGTHNLQSPGQHPNRLSPPARPLFLLISTSSQRCFQGAFLGR